MQATGQAFQDFLEKLEKRRLQAVEMVGAKNQRKNNNYECTSCEDQGGWIEPKPYTINGYEFRNDTWIDCKCIEQKRIKRLIESSNITEEFRNKRFDSFAEDIEPEVIDAKSASKDYYTSFRKIRNTEQNSIALLGESGYGKTHLLMSIANGLLKNGVEVIYAPWVDLMVELRGNWNETHEKISRLQKVEVLFIDDLLKCDEEPSKTTKQNLFAIVNYRYLNKLPIMVSSELTLDKLFSIDKAVASRIGERCADYLVEITAANIEEMKRLNYRLRKLA